jgi:glycosyltransferase involved in cell wall biosynthesis
MSGSEEPAVPWWVGDTTFVVWSPRYKGTRSAWLAAELGIRAPLYFAPTTRRGMRAAPLKYPRQAIATLFALVRRRAAVVFVQSPPSFATWIAAAYAVMARAALVIDVHSDAFERTVWTRPGWLNATVMRRASVTIVTGSHWADRVTAIGGRAVVVPAIPTQLLVGDPPPLAGFNVAVVLTWATDEPVEAVLEAARQCPDVTFHLTGRPKQQRYGDQLPANVRLTGFLDEPTYNALLSHADAVMCLTTRDHTMQNGAAEAVYLGTPVITSDWAILHEYFSRGTIHVDNSPQQIAAAVRRMVDEGPAYRADVRALRDELVQRWRRDRAAILGHIESQVRALRRPTARGR